MSEEVIPVYRYPGGTGEFNRWEFEIWRSEVAYAEGRIVYHEGHLYRASVATTAGQKPKVAMHTFQFATGTPNNPPTYPTAVNDPVDIDLPLWILTDLGADYYYGVLRDVYLGPSDVGSKTFASECRTIVVRSYFWGNYDEDFRDHIYDLPTSSSYGNEKYLTPGMDTEWSATEGDLMFAPSAVELEPQGATSEFNESMNVGGMQYQMSSNMAVAGAANSGDPDYNPYGTAFWADSVEGSLTHGALVSIGQTFGRSYGSFTTPTFRDNWENEGTNEYPDNVDRVVGTSPAMDGT